MKTFHYIVSGTVQGVFFRYYTKNAADRLGIKGTVRNLPAGQVEVYAQGDSPSINQFELFLETGSPAASVDDVARNETEVEIRFPDFKIIH